MKQTNRLETVRSYCAKFPALPNRTIAKLIMSECAHLFPSLEACRTSVRIQRGNNGHAKRKHSDKSLHRPNGTAGTVYKMPSSKCKAWPIFKLDSERNLILSDLHIPWHHSKTLRAAVKWGKAYNPDCILLNGDVCDFYSASRFDRNPTLSSLRKEINATREFLRWLRQEFPKARIVYKFGNHDEWFDRYLWRKAPELVGIPEVGLEHILTTARKNEPNSELSGVEFVKDQQRIGIGHLLVLHGHELGKGSIAPPVNAARGAFLKALECILIGHLHRSSFHPETSIKGKQIAAWSTGCLCGLWPEYARVNKWDHSFAAVHQHRNQMFSVEPVRLLNGEVL